MSVVRFTGFASRLPVAGLIFVWILWTSSNAAESEPVVVSLKPTASVGQQLVLIRDIAHLNGGNDDLRERIRRVDISDTPADDSSEKISRKRVEIRLLLAGIAHDDFVVDGAERVTVTLRNGGVVDAAVVDAIRASLSQQLSLDPKDVEVRIIQPIVRPIVSPETNLEHIELKPYLPLNPRPGKLRVKVGVFVKGSLTHTFSVLLELTLYQTVPIATRVIARREEFNKENIQFERRAVSQQLRQPIPTEMLGKKAKRTIQPQAIIRVFDIAEPVREADIVLIKPRDIVRMVARKGSLTAVVPAGEALQQGRLGELIRLRNPQSKKIVIGRVVSRGEVEIPLY